MFKYLGESDLIKEAVNLANHDMLAEYIYQRIEFQGQYDMSNAPDSKYLADKFLEIHRKYTIDIVVYYPFWRWSKAVGYFSSKKPSTIHINSYKLKNMMIKDLVSTLFHEMGHMMDLIDLKYSYNHGSNSPKNKQNTFQYSLNRFVKDYFAGKTDRIIKNQKHTWPLNWLSKDFN